MKLQKVIFNPQTVKYFLIYILFVPIYTLSFLYGAYQLQKNYGHQAVLSYNNEGIPCTVKGDFMVEGQLWGIKKVYASQIKASIDFPEKEKYLFLNSYAKKETLLRYIGFYTYSLGITLIGCIVIFTGIGKMIGQWRAFFIMLASMITFEPARLIYYLLPNARILEPENMLSMQLNLPPYFIVSVLAVIGIVISFFILRKLYFSGELKSFLIGSLPGALLGWVLWFEIIGPVILPWKS